MFPPVRTRTRAALRRVVDRAIEFAPLGEYGLEVPGADGAHARGIGRSAHSVARRPGAVASPEQLPRRVKAATPAGRRTGDRPTGEPPTGEPARAGDWPTREPVRAGDRSTREPRPARHRLLAPPLRVPPPIVRQPPRGPPPRAGAELQCLPPFPPLLATDVAAPRPFPRPGGVDTAPRQSPAAHLLAKPVDRLGVLRLARAVDLDEAHQELVVRDVGEYVI